MSKNEAYQYHRSGETLLEPSFKKYIWIPIAEALPKEITPNLITFFRLILVVIFFVFALVFSLRDSWWIVLTILLTFISEQLDCIDGVYARLTSTESKFGEFLDHWSDTFLYSMIEILFLLILGANKALILWALSPMMIILYWMTLIQSNGGGIPFKKISSTEHSIIICTFLILFLFFGQQWSVNIFNLGKQNIFVIFAIIIVLFTFPSYVFEFVPLLRKYHISFVKIFQFPVILIGLIIFLLSSNFSAETSSVLLLTSSPYMSRYTVLTRFEPNLYAQIEWKLPALIALFLLVLFLSSYNKIVQYIGYFTLLSYMIVSVVFDFKKAARTILSNSEKKEILEKLFWKLVRK